MIYIKLNSYTHKSYKRNLYVSTNLTLFWENLKSHLDILLRVLNAFSLKKF